MSGRNQRLGPVRLAAMAVLAAAVLGAAVPAVAQETEPAKRGGGSIFKRIWSGITGGKRDPEQADKDAAGEAGGEPAAAPSLATAEWVGFTPVLAVGAAEGAGAWIAGPFPQAGAQGWVTDTVSGLTTPVKLVWRDAEPGSLALLSAEAAAGLGLAPGAVAHVAIYLPR